MRTTRTAAQVAANGQTQVKWWLNRQLLDRFSAECERRMVSRRVVIERLFSDWLDRAEQEEL